VGAAATAKWGVETRRRLLVERFDPDHAGVRCACWSDSEDERAEEVRFQGFKEVLGVRVEGRQRDLQESEDSIFATLTP